MEEAEEEIDCAVGHIDNLFYAGSKLVVTLQEFGFAGQFLFDRLLDTPIEKKLSVRGGIEKPVEVRRVV